MDQSGAEGFRGLPGGCARASPGALTVAAEGQKADTAKPLKGFGSGVFEIVVRHRDTFRVVYVLQLDDALWVIHAFQKKSKSGIATPKPEIDLIKARLKRLKEILE